MPAQNNFKNKFQQGTFANGEGPIHGIEITNEAENKGQINPPTSGRNIKTQGGEGAGDGLDSRAEEKGFDIYGASYKGPQNWKPESKGETPNYAVNSSK